MKRDKNERKRRKNSTYSLLKNLTKAEQKAIKKVIHRFILFFCSVFFIVVAAVGVTVPHSSIHLP